MLIRNLDDDHILCITTCPFCQSQNEVKVTKAAFEAWQRGEYVQNAFADLSAAERELLKTGMCDDCFPKPPKEDADADDADPISPPDPAGDLRRSEIAGDMMDDDPSNWN